MAQNNEKKRILRVGLVHQGRIVEERLLRNPSDVTVGLNPKCTFILPISKPPESYKLFSWDKEKYRLRFTAGMAGKVSIDGRVLELPEVRSEKIAKQEGDIFTLPIGENDAGKIVFGEVRLLYQMVLAPPKPKKIPIPPAAKGGPLKALESAYLWAVAISLVLHLGTTFGAQYWWHASGQYEEEQKRESMVYRVLKSEIVLKEKVEKVEEEVVPGEGEGEGAGEADAGDKEDTQPTKRFTKTASGGGPSSDEEKYRRQVAKVREGTILKFLDGGDKGLKGLVGREAASGDIANAFATAGVASSGGTMVADESYGYKGGAKGGGPGTGGGGGNTYQKMKASDVKGTGALDKKRVETGTKRVEAELKIRIGGRLGEASGPGKINASSIESVFRRRRGAIQSCYERALRVNGEVEGKISIRVTIGTAGTVTNVEVVKNTTGDSAVGTCIIQKVRSWNFPPPDGGVVIFTRHFLLMKS